MSLFPFERRYSNVVGRPESPRGAKIVIREAAAKSAKRSGIQQASNLVTQIRAALRDERFAGIELSDTFPSNILPTFARFAAAQTARHAIAFREQSIDNRTDRSIISPVCPCRLPQLIGKMHSGKETSRFKLHYFSIARICDSDRCQMHAIPLEMFAACAVSGMFDYLRTDNSDNSG